MASAAARPLTTIDLPARPAEECKILVADDDPRIVEVFTAILSRDGYQVLPAADGYEAFELVRREGPDVAVLDVIMPGLDGIEVCRRIKADEATRFLPVILVTGLSARARRLDGLQARADDFLDKPVDPLELTARVRSLLRTKQLYDEVEANRRDLEKRVAERTRELSEANARLEEMSRVKGNVLAIVAHELRTPLHQAKLAYGLVRQEEIEQARKLELYDTIDEAFSALEYRLEDVEVFSDPTDLKLTPVSVPTLITSAAEQVRRLSRQHPNAFELDIPKALPPVMVDAGPLSRALAHVMHNAAKFGEGKPVAVTAASHGDGVKITVRDEGHGISDDMMSKLFLPLQPGDDSTTRRYPGMGIGLALVKMIMDAHHIPIEVVTGADTGTAFSFVLPVAEL